MKLIVVIPTFKEQKNIKILLNKIFKINFDIRVIIVDDTPLPEIKKIISSFKKTIYIHRKNNRGRGSAVKNGIDYALKNFNFDYILEMDADLSHDPSEIKKEIDNLKKIPFDVTIFSRYKKNSKIFNWPIKRKILSLIANNLARFFLKIPISDYTNGYRIYSYNAALHLVNTCGKTGDGFIMLSEILVQLYYNKFTINEVKTTFVNRVRGESSVNFYELFSSILGLFKIYRLKTRLKINSF